MSPSKYQPPLFASDSSYWPQVYIACSLTAVAADQEARHSLSAWCHIIQESIQTATSGGDITGDARSWTVRCDVPLDRSSPWKAKDATPEGIYARNSSALWSQSDAMIVIGFRGGSIGVGQELEWAIQQGIPVLYVQPAGQPVSRQLEGAAHQADITIEPFEEPPELTRIIARWLARRRRTIEDGARIRSMNRDRLVVAQTVMRTTWARLDRDARFEACAVAHIRPRQVNRLLLDLDALASASTGQLLKLTSALGLEIGSLLGPAPPVIRRVSHAQLAALQLAAAENAWDGDTVVELIISAERTLAAPGVRRLRFDGLQDWVRFHDRPRDK